MGEEAQEDFSSNVNIFLDYIAGEIYTFDSCFTRVRATSVRSIEWERRQRDQGK